MRAAASSSGQPPKAPPGSEAIVVKLLLLGDSAVGKTSMLMRFCEETFESNFVLTIGVDFKSKTVLHKDRLLKFQVWDTAGQERFRTITPAYYRKAMGVVICYDITDEASFSNIAFWLTELEKHGDKTVQRILVGNKADLESLRRVPRTDGERLAAEHGMPFFETSAKTGDMVEDAFGAMADLVLAHKYPPSAAGGGAGAGTGAGGGTGGIELRPVDSRKKAGCKC